MTQRIGAFEYFDPSGKKVSHVPNEVTAYSSRQSVNNTAPLIDTKSKLIADYLLFNAYTNFLVNDTDLLKPAKYNFVRDYNPIEVVDTVYKESTLELRLGYLENLEQTLEADKEKEQRIQQNIEGYKNSTVFDFDGFLGDVLDIGVDFLLDQVNSLLPPEYQLSLDLQGGEFQGFAVGGIGYNTKENTISYNGNFFDALVGDGIDMLNDILPDFLSAELGLNSISIGAITVDLDDIANGSTVPVVGDISVSNQNGDIVVNVAGKKISVTNVAEGVARRTLGGLLSGGLTSVNRQLPPGFEVDVQFNNQGFLPSGVSLGPVALDFASGGLSVNAQALTALGGQYLNRYVFNQLPGPLGAIARSAWKALDLGAVFGDSVPPTPPSPNKVISVNNRGESSLPPLVSSPPMVGDFPTGGLNNDVA